ncbi:MAG TPA: PAS domain S-box protein [Polyangia bacterium]|jgi:PAS domain S-box-containing protein
MDPHPTEPAAPTPELLSVLAREFSATTDDYDALMALVARRVSELFGDLCVLRLISPDGRFLEPTAAVYHPNPEMVALAKSATTTHPQRVGEGITGRVAATGEGVLIPVVDPAKMLADLDPERRSAVERQHISSLVVLPLRSRGQVVGVVSLTRSDPQRPINEGDRQLLEDVAAHAALAITNARSFAAERAAHAAAARANQALIESEEAHRLLFEASPLPLFVFDVDTLAPVAVNEATLLLYGYTHEEFMRLKVSDLAVSGQGTAKARLLAWGDAAMAGVSRYRRKDGAQFVAEYHTRALPFAGQRTRIAVIKDITDRYEAEQSRALLAAIVQTANDAIISKRPDGIITSWNDAAVRLFGFASDEAIGKPITIIVPPERLAEEKSLFDRVLAGERIDHVETVRRRKDGTAVSVSISVAPIQDASGAVIGASKTARDLTAQRKAAEALSRTEEQLRHAQKMEAVGRLAGGIAHDFNNILSVILSYSELLLGDLEPNNPTAADIGEIGKAARRAAELTQQLLAFSRQQIIEPKVIDLNDLVASMDKMLRRLLGEDIDLAFSPSSTAGRIRADPGNIHQVIMNLAVNARDAMPTGGQLTIETRNVDLDTDYARAHLGSLPGPHVMLAVSDTGTGMDRATQARIFEPFFTTKEAGKGTGLGLSTVFGIVKQCGGNVWVYSEPGRGTTFKVYLPRVDALLDVALPSHPAGSLRGSETILLVEDQEQVRVVAEGILKRNGYRVIAAQTPGEALRFCERYPGAIALLLTDVVMPQMSGPELATRINATRPEIKVLCMSGYTDDSIIRHGVLDGDMAFLQKPFTPDSLSRKVREVLDAAPKDVQ